MCIAPALHRLGGDLAGGCLVDEAGEATIIDVGVPTDFGSGTTGRDGPQGSRLRRWRLAGPESTNSPARPAKR